LAILAIVVVMTVGTVGMEVLTGWTWIQSFYFMAMIATAEGPPQAPPNLWSSIFAAVMAFVSIGTLIAAFATIFGPFLGYYIHKGMSFAEKELEEFEGKQKKLKDGEQ
jgi:hypothetical protein